MSRNSTSATNDGSTHVALGFLIGLVSLDFGLTTVSSVPDFAGQHSRNKSNQIKGFSDDPVMA
jgi:hypothetical protein